MGGQKTGAPPQKNAGLFQPFIGQRFIKARHHQVGVLLHQPDAARGKALPQRRHPQQEHPGVGVVLPQVMHRHVPGGQDIRPGNGQPHPVQALHVFQRAAAGVVGKKEDTPAEGPGPRDHFRRAGQQAVSQGYRPVQVQHEKPDLL